METGDPTVQQRTAAPNTPSPSVPDLEEERVRAAVEARLLGADNHPPRLGRFVILRKIGQGGMGVVYSGFDEELDRRVAIKVLPGLSTEEAVERMRREAQAMGRLSHPNVVQVYEVGMWSGRVFLAMEFVKGQTLKEWLLERQRAWRDVVSAFEQAGRGLAAAHEAGLIHRDFKPDNVMIDEVGRVKVMDFGLARAPGDKEPDERTKIEDTADALRGRGLAAPLTQTGAVMGTPAYMAPEQHLGAETSARTDQFSFCVALYEALFAERPFPGDSMAVLGLNVTRGAVRKPPKGSLVPGRIREVVLRGLAPSADDRWPSMPALLAEIAKDSAATRRRWWTLAAVSVVSAGIVLGVSESAGRGPRVCQDMEARLAGVWDDSRRDEVHSALVGTGVAFADDVWDGVELELDEYTSAWVRDRAAACQATQVIGEQSAALMDLRMACYDRCLQHVVAVVDVLSKTDRTNIAEARDSTESLPSLDRCADVAWLTDRAPPPSDPADARRLIELEKALANVEALLRAWRTEEALAAAQPLASDAEVLGYRPFLARVLRVQGNLEWQEGDFGSAERTSLQAYEMGVELRDAAIAVRAASVLYRVYQSTLDEESAHHWIVQATAWSKADGAPDQLAANKSMLAWMALTEGRDEEAREYANSAVELAEQEMGVDDPATAQALLTAARVSRAQGDFAAALAAQMRAQRILSGHYGDKHPSVVSAGAEAGDTLFEMGDYEGAAERHREALRILEKALGTDNPAVAPQLIGLARSAQAAGDLVAAEEYLERNLSLLEGWLGPTHSELIEALSWVAEMELSQEKYDEAQEHLGRALSIATSEYGPSHPYRATGLLQMGDLLMARGLPDEALDSYEAGVHIMESNPTTDALPLRFALTTLGAALVAAGRAGEALVYLERAASLPVSDRLRPAQLAELDFALARALWSVPKKAGRDRTRARELGVLARDQYATGHDDESNAGLAEVDAWLAENQG